MWASSAHVMLTVEASGACFAVEVSYGCRLYDERSKFYNFNAQAKSAEMCDFHLTTNELFGIFSSTEFGAA